MKIQMDNIANDKFYQNNNKLDHPDSLKTHGYSKDFDKMSNLERNLISRYSSQITHDYIGKYNPNDLYMWRTMEDQRVRPPHGENNGKIFTRSNKPKTGHPGEDYGCRCIAEPYISGLTEYANQTLISTVNDNSYKWTDMNCALYFMFGARINFILGREVDLTLSQIGRLRDVINHYFYTLGKMNNVNKQIIEKARNLQSSNMFHYAFSGSYSFKDVVWCFGGGTVSGSFHGFVEKHGYMLHIRGTILYQYNDLFTDPVNAREYVNKTSDPESIDPLWRAASDFGGSAFFITDSWKTVFKAEVKADRTQSIYKWDF